MWRNRRSDVDRPMLRMCLAVALTILLPLASGCQTSPSVQLATGQPLTHLTDSELDYVKPGTILTWRDLRTGGTYDERVGDHDGRLYQGFTGARRSFWYPPDPWADDENTKVVDMAPLFPLQVGKKAVFNRYPRAGKMVDTVEVVRAETLPLALGNVDTFVMTTESQLVDGGWTGTATVWYAPALHSVVQMQMDDTDHDHRARQLIAIKAP